MFNTLARCAIRPAFFRRPRSCVTMMIGLPNPLFKNVREAPAPRADAGKVPRGLVGHDQHRTVTLPARCTSLLLAPESSPDSADNPVPKPTIPAPHRVLSSLFRESGLSWTAVHFSQRLRTGSSCRTEKRTPREGPPACESVSPSFRYGSAPPRPARIGPVEPRDQIEEVVFPPDPEGPITQ